MMKGPLAYWLMRCWILLGCIAPALVHATADAPTVILLSWDGFRHDYPERGDFPGLARMAREGLRADRLQSVFPSDTFPNHVSLATGTYPDRHGILGNQFIDRQRGLYSMSPESDWLEAEPLWIAAQRQGITTATYFWVGSEQDWRGQGTRYRVAPFDPERAEADKVDQILTWLALPATERPGLIMCYWHGADRAGHAYGPNSARVVAQLREQDVQLQRLLQGIDALDRWSATTLVLVSDHGMTVTGDYLPVREALADAGIPARMVGTAVGQVFLDQPEQLEAARATIAAVSPVLQVELGTQLPPHWRLQHPQRSGDLVVVVPPPYVLSRLPGFAGVRNRLLRSMGWDFGGHGYDPQLPDMGASFFALGRGVTAGSQLSSLRVIDVAPTVARLLDIDPPLQSEGEALSLESLSGLHPAVHPPQHSAQ